MSDIKKLQDALQAGYPPPSESQLTSGGPLIIEDININPLGLYRESQVDVNDPDVVLFSNKWVDKGERLFYKQSEGKIVVFEDKHLKLHKDLVKK
jgi:hypothetical protein